MIHHGKRGLGKIIFVTGTDTGVGKTLLAGLLLYHLRVEGCHALGMKPFCCGSLDDVKLLQAAQSNELTLDEINPFYFPKPVAPLAAARDRRDRQRAVRMSDALEKIRCLEKKCERLVIEGCGGLLVPLGAGYTVADLIRELNCSVVVVGRNKLGTINHTLLTARTLKEMRAEDLKIVLMEQRKGDFSCKTNRIILASLLGKPVVEFPFLHENRKGFATLENIHKKVKKTLARILE